MYPRFLLLAGLGLFFYFGAMALLYWQQKQLIYFPTPDIEIAQYERWTIEQENQPDSHLWTYNRSSRRAILYFGGNAESLPGMGALLRALFPKHAIYLQLYPGYGGAPGEPGEQALFAQALSLHDRIQDRHSDITVVGRSLGSGVATYLAAERPLSRVALITPFDSIESLAQESLPIFPVRLLLSDRYNSAARADAVEEPVLMIVASRDEIVSRAHSDRLRVAFAPEQVEEVVVERSGHNDISTKREFAMALLLFIDGQPQPASRTQ